jgi:hypothetical protein
MRPMLFAAALLACSVPAIAYADAGPDDGSGKTNGASCSNAAECSSGFCATGVCCSTACTGAAECTAGRSQPAESCATGTCSRPAPTTCAPFACKGALCATTCTTNDDCSSGNVCNGGRCFVTTTCGADGVSLTTPDGTRVDCYPYRCSSDGRCLGSCATDTDCAPDRKCFTDRKVCDDPNYSGKAQPDQSDEGSCAYGHSSTAPFFLALPMLGLIMMSMMRRRR